MIQYSINSQDDRYLFLKGEEEEMKNLTEYLNKIPQYQFLPSYSGIPKPEIHLDFFMHNNQRIYRCFSGLYLEILYWCKANNIQTSLNDKLFYRKPKHSLEEFRDIVVSWNLSLDPYDYQIECAYNIISYKQSLSEIATRAGKTLIGYIVFRYAMLYMGVKKILMIVPSIALVKQGFDDFTKYAEFFDSEAIWGGSKTKNGRTRKEQVNTKNLTIATYQSLIRKCDPKYRGTKNYNPNFFNDYDCVLVDEVHNAKADSIKTILSQPFMKFIKLKFGFSGTLPLKGTLESFTVQELMGGKIQDITSKELRDGGFIADIFVTQYRIKYPEFERSSKLRNTYIKCGEYLCSSFVKDENKKHILRPKDKRDMCMIHEKKLPYTFSQLRIKIASEDNELIKENMICQYTDYIIDACKANGNNLLMLENYVAHHSVKKLELIKNIVKENKGNGILFFHFNEYCKYIYNILKEEFPDKQVLCMTGATTPKNREKYKQLMKENDNVILCANYGVSSTGLTLRLNWGVFVESFKSHVIVKQSAGRGLCLDPSKERFELYDIIDCLPTGKLKVQGSQKIKLYKQEEFDYKIIEI